MSEWQKANLDADFIIPSRELVVKRDEEMVQAYHRIVIKFDSRKRGIYISFYINMKNR